jgi:hypothetical protein
MKGMIKLRTGSGIRSSLGRGWMLLRRRKERLKKREELGWKDSSVKKEERQK